MNSGALLRREAQAVSPSMTQARAEKQTDTIKSAFLWVVPIVLMFERNMPTVAGLSSGFVTVSLLLLYVFVVRYKKFMLILGTVPFFFAAGFITICGIVEFVSPSSDFRFLTRSALMFGGALLLGALCETSRDFRTLSSSFIVVAVAWAGLMILAVVGVLQSGGLAAGGDVLRSQATGSLVLDEDPNTIALISAVGSMLSFILATSRTGIMQKGLYFCSAFCALGVVTSGSRSGLLTLVLCFVAVAVWIPSIRRQAGRAGLVGLVVGLIVLPDVFFDRVAQTVAMERTAENDGRMYLYTAAWRSLGDYFLMGVGDGNYWSSWGAENGFSTAWDGKVSGAHNAFLQVLISWGIIPMLILAGFVFSLVRYPILEASRSDERALALVCCVGLAMFWMTLHVIYHKYSMIMVAVLFGYYVRQRFGEGRAAPPRTAARPTRLAGLPA